MTLPDPEAGTPPPSHQRWRWSQMLQLDLRSLALCRMAFGLLLLWDIVGRWSHLRAHYSDFGVLPRYVLLQSAWDPAWFSLASVVATPGELTVFFALVTLASLGVLLGWRTRWSTFLVWIGLLSLHNRNALVLDQGDAFLRMALFWMLMLPWGARWSLDACQGRIPPSSTVGHSEHCPGSSAVGLAIPLQCLLMMLSLMAAPSARAVATLPWQDLGAVLPCNLIGALELAVLAMLLLASYKARDVAVVMLSVGNLALAGWTSSGLFFPVLALLPLALLGSWWWDGPLARTSATLQRWTACAEPTPELANASSHSTILARTFQLSLLLFVFGWAFCHLATNWSPPEPLAATGRLLGLAPGVERFPLVADAGPGTLRFKGTRRDGTTFDHGSDQEPSLALNDWRWRNYQATLEGRDDAWLDWSYGHYLCRAWSPKQRSLFDVDKLQLIVRSKASDHELLDHRCFRQARSR